MKARQRFDIKHKPKGRISGQQVTGTAATAHIRALIIALPRIARRTADRSKRLIAKDIIEIADPEAVIVAGRVHLVNIRHVEAESEVVVCRRLLVLVERGLGRLKG